MADFRAETDKIQDEPGMTFCIRKHVNTERMMGSCQRGTGARLKRLPPAKMGTNLNIKIMIVTDYNQ